jgi:flagellar biosynthesis protein FlhB
MADEDLSDKKHAPTDKRKEELREKGSFLRSRELTSGFVLILGMFIIAYITPTIVEHFKKTLTLCFESINQVLLAPDDLGFLYKKLAESNLMLLVPVMVPLFFTIFIVAFMFGGLTWSFSALKPKLSRFNVLNNLKRMVAAQAFFELSKSVVKVFLFFGVLAVFLFFELQDIFNLMYIDNNKTIFSGFMLITLYLTMMAVVVIVIMVVDMLYSRYRYNKMSKMTDVELKDETKSTQGNPEIKRRIRSAQMQIAKRRMRRDVPNATVVITNPTHYAVALKYDAGLNSEPIVVAKGRDLIAQDIRMLAIKHGVPLYEAPPLARALFNTAKVGDAIHKDLYMAVAIVLSYIYQLKRFQYGQGDMPEYIADLQIPEHMKYEE